MSQAAAQLLEGEQPDRLLAERAGVTRLRRLEQVAGNVTQPVRGHPAARVVDGDHRPNTLAPQQNADAPSGNPRLGVVVGGVGHELVEGVLGILVCLAGDEHSLGEVADPQADALAFASRSTLSAAGRLDGRRAR